MNLMLLLYRHKKSSKLLFILLLFFMLSFSAVIISCGESQPLQEGWELKVSDLEPDLTFTYLDDWELLTKTYQNGVLSLQLEKQDINDTVNLVVTVIPALLNSDEMIEEAKKLLQSGLYQPRDIKVIDESNRYDDQVVILDAVAGGEDTVYVRTAGLTADGRAYFFTVLAREESYLKAVYELDQIIDAKIAEGSSSK